MKRIMMLVAACAGLGYMQSATAETLRCGSALIEPGDDATYVLENCVEPTQSGANPLLYQMNAVLAQSQRWRIVREDGQFRAVVVIGADGRVEDIQFDRRRD
jgi:hypothetical protein